MGSQNLIGVVIERLSYKQLIYLSNALLGNTKNSDSENNRINRNNRLLEFNNQLNVKGYALILPILQKHFVNLQFNRLFHILAKKGLLI